MLSRLLADHTTLRLGGPAARIDEVHSEGELLDAIEDADVQDEQLLLLGGGSNVVVADEGFPGSVVLIRSSGTIGREGAVLHVAAGEPWDALVERCVAEDRPGIVCLSGIPGAVGATPIQNVGAYGQEVADVIAFVRVLDRRRGAVGSLAPQDCRFGYRTSRFKREPGRYVVLSVGFQLPVDPAGCEIRYAELARRLGVEPGARVPADEVRRAVLELRAGKGMVLDPRDPDTVSAGSFFTNPVLDDAAFRALEARARYRLGDEARVPRFEEGTQWKTSAAWLIQHAGFEKGDGNPDGIAISGKHVLALTNRGHGTTAELVALAREIAGGVQDRFGIELEPEPVFCGHRW